MQKTIFLVFFLIAGIAYAQKVNIEKGIISVNKQAFLKYDDSLKESISLQTLNGNEIAVIKAQSFEAPKTKRSENPNDRKQSATGTVNYYVVSFTEFDLEFETDMTLSKLYAAFHKYELMQQGQVSVKNAKRIGSKLADDISVKKPAVKRKN